MAATTADNNNKKKKYEFFNPKLREPKYDAGDIYDDNKLKQSRANWDIVPEYDKPYLKHVKSLSTSWRHLGLLADFMQVSTTPTRWNDLNWQVGREDGRRKEEIDEERKERWERTNVALLEYSYADTVRLKRLTSSRQLREELEGDMADKWDDDEIQLRLFVVEDLSRDVIEQLGSHLDIEPDFFREHVVDYAWYNTRDYWRSPRNLNIVSKRQRFFQIRYVTARYFETPDSFTKGFQESKLFNVLRRPDNDQNRAYWDTKEAIVGLTRSRASFWSKRADGAGNPVVAVLLLDPSIKAGFPLWRGYRNWAPTPSVHAHQRPPSSDRESFFEDFLHWAQQPSLSAFFLNTGDNSSSSTHLPIQALLHLVCAEWLTIADYLSTRLNQIDWEISHPEYFLNEDNHIDIALKKLHVWRRYVPLFREMLLETFERVFRHDRFRSTIKRDGDASTGDEEAINAYRHDFEVVLSYMEDYQKRIDRLSGVVAAVINIEESRRAMANTKNLGRLTWLATLFIPFSLIASLFSMQIDITQLSMVTIKWYFAVTLPFTVMTLGLAFILSWSGIQRYLDCD